MYVYCEEVVDREEIMDRRLKLSRDSKRIKKVPQLMQSHGLHRPPVIIHTYSPKVIHTDACHFMWMVQRLTGSSHTRLRCDQHKPTLGISSKQTEAAQTPFGSQPVSPSEAAESVSDLFRESNPEESQALSALSAPLEGRAFLKAAVESPPARSPKEKVGGKQLPPECFDANSRASLELELRYDAIMPSLVHSLASQFSAQDIPSPTIFSTVFLRDLPALSTTSFAITDSTNSSIMPHLHIQPDCSVEETR
ncbi:hypothetical protein O6H91_01G054300 [Diphasiastrum complanatum]|uniref:Uncharacterized protein n=1 Tax=Diphasiastrum complanatum TaxID=34168 RepID=A0ACC2ER55_DIPCM|nr:hypothetical protein O6H91_01G054300 [Diphasiastrum complanatum]